MPNLYLDTSGDNFVLQVSVDEAYILHSILEFVSRESTQEVLKDKISPQEIELAESISSELIDFLTDEITFK